MRFAASLLSAAGLAALLLHGTATAQTLNRFTATYKGGSSSCTTTYSIEGREPATPGAYPVFIYTVGTNESYTHASAIAAIDTMAARGYVAATLQYPNASFGTCSTLSGRARCIFDAASASSAVQALCARPNADCSKGIVTGGFSQGSIMAILAKNYDSRVQAAWGLGAGVNYSGYDLSSCVADGKRTLPSDRLRAINGEADGFMGGNISGVRSQLQTLTGLSCGSTATDCARANSSGWTIVRNTDVVDGAADHCYMRHGGCVGSTLDDRWRHGSSNWSLDYNLNWLSGFTQH